MKNKQTKYLLLSLLALITIIGITVYGNTGKILQGNLSAPGITPSNVSNLNLADPNIIALQNKISSLEKNQTAQLAEISSLKQTQTTLLNDQNKLTSKITFIESQLHCIQWLPAPTATVKSVTDYVTYLDVCLKDGNVSSLIN